MTGLLAGRVAVITGAASPRGIGWASARLFAQHGARLALLDRDGEAAQARAAALGDGHCALPLDVRDPASCRSAVAHVETALGPPEILVHIAGIMRPERIMAITQDGYDAVMDTNLRGTLNICQAVIPIMRARRAGSIACMASVAAQRGGGVMGGAHYSASKAGVLGFTRAMARELAPDNVRVNAVAPGPIDTDVAGAALDAEWQRQFSAQIPLGRIGQPDDVAGAFLFLASDLSAYVTGAVIDVNGGLHIH